MSRLRGAIENRRRRFLAADDLPPASRRAAARTTDTADQPNPAAPDTGGLNGARHLIPLGPPTDQGRTQACGGFAIANGIMARAEVDGTPMPPALADAYAMQCYRWALSGIRWGTNPGHEDYATIYALTHHLATSGRAAASLDEIADAIRAGSPVVISVAWYASMSAATGGIIRVVPDDRDSFHFIVLTGYDPARDCNPISERTRKRKARVARKRGKPLAAKYKPQPRQAFQIRNSWGKGWGLDGSAWVTADDLGHLLARGPAAVNNAHYSLGWSPVDPAALYEADSARHGR